MKKHVCGMLALLCALVLLAGSLPVSANDGRTIQEVQAEIDAKKQHLTDLANQIEDKRDDRQAALNAFAEYEAQYNELLALIDEQAALIDSTADRLDAKTAELSDTIVSIQENKEEYTRRLRAIDSMNNSNAVLAAVFQGDSFSDMMAVADGLQRIARRDTELLQQLADQRATYERQKKGLEDDIATLNAEMDELQANRDWCDEKMQEMQALIDSANYQIRLKQQESDATEEEVKKLRAELAAIFASLQSNGSKAGDGSVRYDGPLLWPVPGYGTISSYYGVPRSNTGTHYGIDIPAPVGTPIISSGSGTVLTATWHYSYGYYVVVDHGQGLRTLYAHCSELWVGAGETVEAGEAIAGMGNTGNSFGSHLHYEVHEHGGRQNPLGSGYLNP